MERKDSLKRFGLIADVREAIFRIPFLNSTVYSFILFLNEDNAFSKKFKLCFELKASLSFLELNLIHCELAKQVADELKILNNNILEYLKMAPSGNEPHIEFYSMGGGPFRDSGSRLKSRYISKI